MQSGNEMYSTSSVTFYLNYTSSNNDTNPSRYVGAIGSQPYSSFNLAFLHRLLPVPLDIRLLLPVVFPDEAVVLEAVAVGVSPLIEESNRLASATTSLLGAGSSSTQLYARPPEDIGLLPFMPLITAEHISSTSIRLTYFIGVLISVVSSVNNDSNEEEKRGPLPGPYIPPHRK